MGIGVHHAGMLPRYRRLVETLAQAGLLKVICGTDTLGVGINVPIRTVVLTGLAKYDGVRVRHLRAREFHQIAGRAGRAGFDTLGSVVVQAPEHEVENARLVRKAGDDPKKLRRVQRKKPPEGFVNWGEKTFERLVAAEPEPLTSSFAVSHSMLLNVIARPGDPFAAMRRLLTDNDEDEAAQRRHIRHAVAIARSLLAGDVVERLDPPDADGRGVRLTVDLQPNFALDQPLSAFALATLGLLDQDSPTYALDVVSVIEATLEDPRQVIAAQLNKARGEAVAAMKSEGIEYDERIELLDEVTHPQPLAELLEAAYETYRTRPSLGCRPRAAPEVGGPRHVRAGDDVRRVRRLLRAGPVRGSGAALPHRRLPGAASHRPGRRRATRSSRTSSRGSVSSPGRSTRHCSTSGRSSRPVTTSTAADLVRPPRGRRGPPGDGNPRAFRVLVRNAMFRRVELAARRDWAALAELDADAGWSADDWQDALGGVLGRARRAAHRRGRPGAGAACRG